MTAVPTTNTVAMSPATFDVFLDANGNIAIATPPFAVAQDVATAVETFLGEELYDDTLGVDYKGQILGKRPTLAVVQSQVQSQALLVPGVTQAQLIVEGVDETTREATGQIQFLTSDGAPLAVGV